MKAFRYGGHKENLHTPLMATASALDYALGLPAELRSNRPCEHGLVLLQAFLMQPRNSTPPAQPYRESQGIPFWQAFAAYSGMETWKISGETIRANI